MTPKQKATEIYHNCLNIGKGMINDYACGLYAMYTVDELIEQTENDFFKKVRKELKKILNWKS